MIKMLKKIYAKPSINYNLEIYIIENSFCEEIEGLIVNTYIMVIDNKYGIIIDPGSNLKEIYDSPEFKHLEFKYILLTHFHVDHIAGLDVAKQTTNAQICISAEDGKYLNDSRYTLTNTFGVKDIKSTPDKLLNHLDILKITEDVSIRAHLTPGHTVGGMCFEVITKIPETHILFTGDTMFKNTYGRVDFPTGSIKEMKKSLRYIYDTFKDDTLLLPGHDEITFLKDNKYLVD